MYRHFRTFFRHYLRIEREENPIVDEFNIRRFRQSILDGRLKCRHNEEDGERHHDSVGKVIDVKEKGHVSGQNQGEGLKEYIDQMIKVLTGQVEFQVGDRITIYGFIPEKKAV